MLAEEQILDLYVDWLGHVARLQRAVSGMPRGVERVLGVPGLSQDQKRALVRQRDVPYCGSGEQEVLCWDAGRLVNARRVDGLFTE